MNKWRGVENKAYTKRDLADWKPKQYIKFLRFCETFMYRDEEGKDHYSVTKSRWLNACKFLDMPDHPFHEYLYRINTFDFQARSSSQRFASKLLNMMRTVLSYIKENPAVVSEKMREIIEPNTQFNWCLKSTKVVKTAVGEVLAPDTNLTFGHHTKQLTPLDQIAHETLRKAMNILQLMMEQLTPAKIKKMTDKDLVLAVTRLMPAINQARNFRPNRNIYQQININASSREELEADILNVNSKKDES